MSKTIWTFLLLFTGVLALWRGTVGALSFWNYERLSVSELAVFEKIDIRPKNSKYALEVAYAYEYQGKMYTGRGLLSKPYYLNRVSAEDAASRFLEMEGRVYFDPARPHVSALQSRFPLRDVFYGVCLLGVFFYFVYLRIHLSLLSKEM